MASSIFSELAARDPSTLLFAQAKMTYVGMQSEPVRSVVFSVYTCVPDVGVFTQSYPELHYGNDTLDALSTFTVKHAQFVGFLDLLASVPVAADHSDVWASISIMPDLREDVTHELVVKQEPAESLIDDFVDQLGSGYSVARLVLEDFKRGP
ncbi:MAG: hypothetical protein AAGK02_04975 [Pseudomonadota bacterium]